MHKVITSWNLINSKNVKKYRLYFFIKIWNIFWNIFRWNFAWFGQILCNVNHGWSGFAFMIIINGT